MKTRAMAAASVVQSDLFMSMSIEAQWLYLMLMFHVDVVGRILGLRRIARGYGIDDDFITELESNGFLIRANGEWFDRHTWRNNKFSQAVANRAQADEAIDSGLLGFEGEPFRSSYAKASKSHTAAQNSYETLQDAFCCDVIEPNDNATQPSSNATKPVTEPAIPMSSTSKATGMDESRPCQCRKCGGQATFAITDDGTWIDCPKCGTYQYGH